MKWILSICTAIALSAAMAQEHPATPATDLEQFQNAAGKVIYRGRTEIGSFTNTSGGLVLRVFATEAQSLSNEHQIGMMVAIGGSGFPSSRAARGSYLDYSEMGGFITGMKHLIKGEKNTKLDALDGIYRTKGNLYFKVSYSESGPRFTVGTLAGLEIPLENPQAFIDVVEKCKEQLDTIRKEQR